MVTLLYLIIRLTDWGVRSSSVAGSISLIICLLIWGLLRLVWVLLLYIHLKKHICSEWHILDRAYTFLFLLPTFCRLVTWWLCYQTILLLSLLSLWCGYMLPPKTFTLKVLLRTGVFPDIRNVESFVYNWMNHFWCTCMEAHSAMTCQIKNNYRTYQSSNHVVISPSNSYVTLP